MKTIILFFIITMITLPLSADWTSLNTGVSDHLYGSYFIDSSTGYATGWGSSSGAVILKTTNSGQNWQASIPRSGAYLFSVSFTDGNNGYAVGCDYGITGQALVLRTTTAGQSWSTTLLSGCWGLYVVDFPTSTTGLACGWNGRIYKSTNSGGSWNAQSTGTGNVFRWMKMVNSTIGYAVAGSNFNNPNMLYKTTNGGQNWSYTYYFSGAVIGGIYFFDEDTGVAVGNNGTEAIYKTTNGGTSWTPVFTGSSGSVFQGVHFHNGRGWAVGDAGRIVRSDNYGDSWQLDAVVAPAVTLLSVFDTGDVVYATGASGKIFKNEDLVSTDDPPHTESTWIDQNYPNPIKISQHTSTNISFLLSDNGNINISIYNTKGQKIKTIVNEQMLAGDHPVQWDGTDYSGSHVPTGIYMYKFSINDNVKQIKRCTVLQ